MNSDAVSCGGVFLLQGWVFLDLPACTLPLSYILTLVVGFFKWFWQEKSIIKLLLLPGAGDARL
jgi:hypothetical protein